MSVVIVNLTGNLDGFEDDFAVKLSSLTKSSTLISLRGEEALNLDPVSPDVKVLVFVCHGWRNGDETELDIGLDKHPYSDSNYFSSPDILSTFVQNIRSNYIVFYCVCDSFSPESIVSFDNEEQCLGTISNKIEVDTTYVAEIADLLNKIYGVLTSKCSKETIVFDIHNIMKKRITIEGLRDFVFSENFMVIEDKE